MPAFETGRFLHAGERVALGGTPVAHHIVDVLRVRRQDGVVLFHAGQLYDAVVEDASREGLSVTVISMRKSPFLAHPVTLLQAVIRPALLDETIRLLAPLGVSTVVLFAAERSQPWNITNRLERLRQIALAGAEQSEIGIVPSVELKRSLDDGLSSVHNGGNLILCSPSADQTILQAGRAGLLVGVENAIAIGPEGGFTLAEETLLKDHGALSVRMNTGILRSELAGFSATLLVRELQALS